MTTTVKPTASLEVSRSSSRISYKRYVALRSSTPSSSVSAKTASQGITCISELRRCEPRVAWSGGADPIMETSE
eukprot:CAMPEP_0206513188 /NCGR_PEP_ID=MMETSP0324_2-20121206/61357_1 /ASSEMBLY_ACC=CAM_ASM_000836 /TAXON_ID=2866 /ORGANISM="Crypthecodinium cohnii, Strain Seligo" /LENGTH=73 /DNA_ID=CAMNT_0054005351 /DNA_START=14 /DNA_END=235 /DNA_ORIENTATION=+